MSSPSPHNSSTRYRVGGQRGASTTQQQQQNRHASSTTTPGGHNNNPRGSTSFAQSFSSSSPAASINPTSPSFGRRQSKFKFTKEGTEVSKSLSFEPSEMIKRRKNMCARRGELGAEKVICHGRSVLDDDNDEAEYQYRTQLRQAQQEYLLNNPQFLGTANSRSGKSGAPSFMNESAVVSQQQQQSNLAFLNAVEAPSPLNRFFNASIENDKDGKKNKRYRSSSASPGGHTRDIFADNNDTDEELDEEENEEEEEEADLAVNMPLPDWRVLLGKEFYTKEKDKMEIIKDRYSVATNPEDTKKKGRRRSSVSRGVLESSVRK